MSEIRLSGLAGSHPLGALAAFGLLRCCDDVPATGRARLSWSKEGDWVAVLETGRPLSADGLISALASRQPGRCGRPELHWADSPRTEPHVFTDAARSAVRQATPERREYADFLAAFACEVATTDSGGLEPNAFYMTSGRQQFLKEARTLATRLGSGITLNQRRKGAEEMFREALLGPWRYEDPQHSLGWDPATERLHALRGRSPTREPAQGVTAAVWLAFEALPLFPCFLSRGRLLTRGFGRAGGGLVFSWPLWTEPASLPTVRSLVALEELTREKPPLRELRERGVAAVFRCERYKPRTQGNYFIFRPVCPCAT
jgi:hypothetical protein